MDKKTYNALVKILDYIGEDEEKHFEESGKPKDHIYRSIILVSDWMAKMTTCPHSTWEWVGDPEGPDAYKVCSKCHKELE
mgnify:FL=1